MADTLYVHDDGLAACLDSITGKTPTPIGNKVMRLFTAPTTDNQAKVIGNFTEATFPGYATVTLVAATWAAGAVAAHVATSQYGTPVAFVRTAGAGTQLVYGWYVTDAGSTKLYFSALFAAGPYNIANVGDTISVQPTLSEQSLN